VIDLRGQTLGLTELSSRSTFAVTNDQISQDERQKSKDEREN